MLWSISDYEMKVYYLYVHVRTCLLWWSSCDVLPIQYKDIAEFSEKTITGNKMLFMVTIVTYNCAHNCDLHFFKYWNLFSSTRYCVSLSLAKLLWCQFLICWYMIMAYNYSLSCRRLIRIENCKIKFGEYGVKCNQFEICFK